MAKPTTNRQRATKRAPAKPPVEEAPKADTTGMFDDEAAKPPAEQADQAAIADQGTSADGSTEDSGKEEAPAGPETADVSDGDDGDDGEDGEAVFDEVFGNTADATPMEEVVEATAAAHEPPPAEAPAQPNGPSDRPVRVQLGRINGVLYRVPVEAVQALLGQPALDRIASLESSGAVQGLEKRMRGTDGRCAPMIFTVEKPDSVPVLFGGLESLAAAKNIGLSSVSLVTVASDDAGAVQSWLSQPGVKAAEHEHEFLSRG